MRAYSPQNTLHYFGADVLHFALRCGYVAYPQRCRAVDGAPCE